MSRGAVTQLVFGAYPVAKAAIDHMMRNAADEYASVEIRFNSVRPGFVTTEIMDGHRNGIDVDGGAVAKL